MMLCSAGAKSNLQGYSGMGKPGLPVVQGINGAAVMSYVSKEEDSGCRHCGAADSAPGRGGRVAPGAGAPAGRDRRISEPGGESL
ncbi:E3 ubiquitin-protein ligase NEDD4-like [Manis javanica]|nr:E3 ubiquitin-protein ligase NEDD4-like [Manis javanica]